MAPRHFPGSGWQLSYASVRGKGHIDGDLPNQDSVKVRSSKHGDVVCAVVSDGAGTAARSQEGSKLATQLICEQMCEAAERLYRSAGLSPGAVRDAFEHCIIRVRESLHARGASLSEFHCTMVAWISTPGGAYIAQIGDSVALSTSFKVIDEAGARQVDFFPGDGCVIYEPQRGEYSNETHFLTEPDWQSQLRISRVPDAVDAVLLMTDGAMDIAVLRGKVFRGFLSNLVAKLQCTPDREARRSTIETWLGAPQTYGVTADDKTLFVAIRPSKHAWTDMPVYLGAPPAPAPRRPGPQKPQAGHPVQARAVAPVRAPQTVTPRAGLAARPWVVPSLLALAVLQSLALAATTPQVKAMLSRHAGNPEVAAASVPAPRAPENSSSAAAASEPAASAVDTSFAAHDASTAVVTNAAGQAPQHGSSSKNDRPHGETAAGREMRSSGEESVTTETERNVPRASGVPGKKPSPTVPPAADRTSSRPQTGSRAERADASTPCAQACANGHASGCSCKDAAHRPQQSR
jgi:hypothetical protein